MPPLRGIALVLCAAALGACGDAEAPQAASGSPVAVANDPAKPLEPARAAPTKAHLSPDDIAALVTEWEESEDAAARRRVEARLLAGGEAVLLQLVAWIGDPEHPSAEMLVPPFGRAATLPLLARFQTAEDDAKLDVCLILEAMVPEWRDAAEGPAVARALLPLIADKEFGGSVAGALGRSGAAGRTIARELAERFLGGDAEVRETAGQVLLALGSDAAPAAPLLVAAMDYAPPPRKPGDAVDPGLDAVEAAAARCEIAASILEEIGSSDPSVLDALRKLLSPATFPPVRGAAARAIRSWGDAAAAAAPELLALLGSPAEGTAAAEALCRMPSQADRVATALADAVRRGDPWTREPSSWDALLVFAADARFAARLAALLPSLPPRTAATVHFALAEGGAVDLAPYAEGLLANPDPSTRCLALDVWSARDGAPALPVGAAKWLEDPDPAVRARAATILAERRGASVAALRVAARALLADGTPSVRYDAIRALGAIADEDPASLDAILFTLDTDPEDDVRQMAAEVLAGEDGALAGEHREGVEWAADRVATSVGGGAAAGSSQSLALVRVLLRLEGGSDALVAALASVLDAGGEHAYAGAAWARRIAFLGGPRLATLRPALERRRASATVDQEIKELDGALAAISGDPVRIALSEDDSEDTVKLLLSMGQPGRSALPLLAGGDWGGTAVADHLRGVSLAAEIFAAANAVAPDPLAERRRIGAARLGRSLPSERAIALWSMLAGDASDRVRAVVLSELGEAEERSPGAVPAALVGAMLDDAILAPTAASLAGRLGPRAADLVPALRRLRDAGEVIDAADAAVALWRITRSAPESLPSLRRLLEARAGEDEVRDWDDVAAALSEMPLERRDLDAILAVIVTSEIDARLTALVPLLDRFGADAAPAIPALRRMLAYRDCEGGVGSDCGEEAARTLGAIGAAARPAIPDLRRWASWSDDPGGVAAEAIRRIEARDPPSTGGTR